jgi:hypothetical protein
VSNPDSFEVHLRSLTDFAWELDGQLEALRLTRDRLAALGEKAEPLGEFAEAHSLSRRHRLAANEMVPLIDTLRQAIGFAAGITRAVAQSYEDYDDQAAAAIRQGGGGTVYYSTQYRSAASPEQQNGD